MKAREAHGRAKTGAGIPASGDGKAVSAARGAVASDDVCEANVGLGVDPRVQEAERGLAFGEAGIVDEGDDAGHQWAGGAGTGNPGQGVVPEEGEVEALC